MHRDAPFLEHGVPGAVVRRRSTSSAGCVRTVCGLEEGARDSWVAGSHGAR
jgi:hypothetical protein